MANTEYQFDRALGIVIFDHERYIAEFSEQTQMPPNRIRRIWAAE